MHLLRSIASKQTHLSISHRLINPVKAFQNSIISSFSTDAPETGTVKFYQVGKAYGFITADADDEEIFVHRTMISGAPEDDNKNPILKSGERMKFSRVQKEGEDGKFAAKDVVYEDGSKVPVYRSGHLDRYSKGAKLELGMTVYDILSEGADEEEMAQRIADAYTKARDRIDRLKKKIERETS